MCPNTSSLSLTKANSVKVKHIVNGTRDTALKFLRTLLEKVWGGGIYIYIHTHTHTHTYQSQTKKFNNVMY